MGLAAAATASALLAIGQLLGIDFVRLGPATPQLHDRAYANLTQPDLCADHLCLGLASLSFLAARRRWPLLGVALGRHPHAVRTCAVAVALGLVVVPALAIVAARWLLAHLRSRPGLESGWLLTVLGILLLHSLVEYPIWYANSLVVAVLVLGAGEAQPHRSAIRLGRPLVLGAGVLLGAITRATSFNAYRGLERLFVGPAGEALPSVLMRESQRIETQSLFVPYVEFAYSGLLRADGVPDPEALTLNTRANCGRMTCWKCSGAAPAPQDMRAYRVDAHCASQYMV